MMDRMSTTEEDGDSRLNQRIAQRVRALRAARGLSLDAAAGVSGVSRSMISLIERGEASATAVVLEKLATGLGVPLASLFDSVAPHAGGPLVRAAAQPWWQDPQSGYRRRNVSPPGSASPIRIVEAEFPPGARIAYETGPREPAVDQQVWLLEGALEVTVGDTTHRLQRGDCLAMVLDQPVAFHNPTRRTARYAVVLVAQPPHPGRRSHDDRDA